MWALLIGEPQKPNRRYFAASETAPTDAGAIHSVPASYLCVTCKLHKVLSLISYSDLNCTVYFSHLLFNKLIIQIQKKNWERMSTYKSKIAHSSEMSRQRILALYRYYESAEERTVFCVGTKFDLPPREGQLENTLFRTFGPKRPEVRGAWTS